MNSLWCLLLCMPPTSTETQTILRIFYLVYTFASPAHRTVISTAQWMKVLVNISICMWKDSIIPSFYFPRSWSSGWGWVFTGSICTLTRISGWCSPILMSCYWKPASPPCCEQHTRLNQHYKPESLPVIFGGEGSLNYLNFPAYYPPENFKAPWRSK